MQFPQSAIHTEAEACLQGLTAAMNWGMTGLIVESDCQVLIHALNSQDYDRSPIGVLIRDARMLARLNFSSCSFSFCKRECNKVAHAMAALGVSGMYGNGLLWPDNVPNDVVSLVVSDLATPVV